MQILRIETDHRSSLLPSTVSDLISVKINHVPVCHESECLFTSSLLNAAKRATARSLKEQETPSITTTLSKD